jgi:hypothetical protein
MRIRFEQAVYGSFPFWNRGYGVLAHSQGCRPEWLAELRTVCQRYGEPSTGATPSGGFFALRLQCGPWLFAGVRSLGCDDLGRPGAMSFHALFVGRWAYRLAGNDPFAFEDEIRGDWCESDQGRALPRGQLSCRLTGRSRRSARGETPQADSIVTALSQRRRVLVQSSTPIGGLAREVWSRLPGRVRRRASVATWAFDTGNDFDMIALPKLNGIVLDSSDLMLSATGLAN